MPTTVTSADLQQVLWALGRFPEGASLREIEAVLGSGLHVRSLQRRLAMLVQTGRVQVLGGRRSTRYRTATHPVALHVAEEADSARVIAEAYVPLSPESAEIKAYVRRPIQGRKPVGYSFEFLADYVPNQTLYLPASLREQLHQIGRSPASQAAAGTFARDILNRLLIDLSWASSRLEGNTYNRLDTERLIAFGEAAEGKDSTETQMILNHKAAIEYLVHGADSIGADADTVIALHALLSDGLLYDPMACGRLRVGAVGIGKSVYSPLAMPQRVQEMFSLALGKAGKIKDPFEQAFFLMVHLPYLQPFEDVNKRVSRLAANIPLIKANLCPVSFIDVPAQAYVDGVLGVYEMNRVDLLRDVFVWAYERSCQQYVAVHRELVPPDRFRMRHRAALAEAVRAIVRAGKPLTEKNIQSAIPLSMVREERVRFGKLVQEEFKSLHAGNAVRFGLRPLEIEAWAKKPARVRKS